MADGYLTTHVLDTARGVPAARMRIALDRLVGGHRERLAEVVTNGDGRTDGPILPRDRFAPGIYELTFHAGDYLMSVGSKLPSPVFLGEIPIRFGMVEGHYHVPLLLSPYGYSTYRGS